MYPQHFLHFSDSRNDAFFTIDHFSSICIGPRPFFLLSAIGSVRRRVFLLLSIYLILLPVFYPKN